MVRQASIGAGGVAATPVRARKTEAACSASPGPQTRSWQPRRAARRVPAHLRHARLRRLPQQVLGNLLQRFWLESQGMQRINLESLRRCEDRMNARRIPRHGGPGCAPMPSIATCAARLPHSPGRRPASPPHESARAQVAGAATYVDDIPEVRGTLHAAPILSTWRTAACAAWTPPPRWPCPACAAWCWRGDIPGDPMLAAFADDEPVFAIDTVQHIGQVVAWWWPTR